MGHGAVEKATPRANITGWTRDTQGLTGGSQINLFIIVPIFIGIVFLLLLVQLSRGAAEWLHNNSLPVRSVPALAVSERTETRSGASNNTGRRVWTDYHVTFELESGERLEFSLYGKDFGVIVGGDKGILTYQRTRYHGFQQQVQAFAEADLPPRNVPVVTDPAPDPGQTHPLRGGPRV